MIRSTRYRSGLSSPLATLNARRRAGIAARWIVALLLILMVGRMSMDDEIVAAQMADELAAAVATVNARAPRPSCEPLDRRKAHPAARVANQCRDGGDQ